MEKKHFIFIMAFLSFILCIFFIQESYAKYLTATSENATMNVARWRILVNNKDIREGSTTNAQRGEVSRLKFQVFEGNEHIANGIIAPTSEGYFDLVIDATEADVSFKYSINFSVNNNSSVTDLIATKYSINNGEFIYLDRDNQSISNQVLQVNNTNPINIRVYVLWDDGENATMDNTADTEATKNNNTAKMDVNLSFTQLK